MLDNHQRWSLWLLQDSEMQALHDAHIREMTKLSYELERAKTATELAQMRYRQAGCIAVVLSQAPVHSTCRL